MSEIKTILLTTDFSDVSRRAFGHAREIAEAFGARILLAHVEEGHLPPLFIEYANVGLEELEQRQVDRATEQLATIREELGSRIEVEPVVLRGVPHVEIVRFAESSGADLIVMTTHGRGFISHAILGSTTERVIRRAPCPVLAVRERHSA